MLAADLNKLNPNEHDVRYWYKEIALQLADLNGNLYAIRNVLDKK